MVLSFVAQAQSITNGNFSSKASGWGCSPEAVHVEKTYGGPSTTNIVAEVDRAAGLCQTVAGFGIGNVYQISFDCSRRTTCGPTLQTMDLTISGGALSQTVSRNGGGFGFSSESFTFTATATSHTITFNGTVSGTCGLILDNIEISLVSVLPVELVHFDAKPMPGKLVELTWATASELNNDYFTIERSVDGNTWEAIDHVYGAGTSNEINEYESLDMNPVQDVMYYRLKQTDYDGSFDYSEVRLVLLNEKTSKQLKVFPNPTSDWTIVKSEKMQDESIHVINSVGVEVSLSSAPEFIGSGYKLDISSLPNGMYTVLTEQGTTYLVKN
ncbi:MAG: hypothetical protein JJ975_07830 [Bacteroidia bacterium]|nr:hypothetical protein [Bacteroidia bacterium]